MNKNKSNTFTFRVNPNIDLEKIHDSVEIESGTTLASLQADTHQVTLEVVGEIKIFFNPDKNGEADEGDCYVHPSEFPQELKDIISGKSEIYRKDGDIKEIKHVWSLDDRIYVDKNNWFEIFRDNESVGTVYAEGYTTEQIFGLLLEVYRDGNGDFTNFRTDVPIEYLSETAKDAIYRQVWAEHVKEDVKARLRYRGIELTEDAVGDIAYRYVYEGQYDCNFSYWDNLDNHIDRY